MRNAAKVFVLILLLCLLAGCDVANKTGGEANFNATVLEISGNLVTVEPLAGEDILRSADRITFASDSLDEIGASVGDIITITYTGAVMESYPAQINAVSWSILEKAEPENIPQPSAEPTDAASPVEDKTDSTYPKQAAEYLRMSLDGSVLLYFNRANEHGELILPDVNYSDARMSPDGNHILCKINAGGAGEARWCGYSVVSLVTNPAEIYAYNGEQWGFQKHIWLDSSLIGFASGSVIGGQENTWKSIQLFDYKYNPIDVTLQLPADENSEIVGIGYIQANQIYIVIRAESTSMGDNPFSENRMILSFLDSEGALMSETVISEEYQSPYSPNLMMLIPSNPLITSEGHILITAQAKADTEDNNYNRRVLLVLSPYTQTIPSLQELPLGYALRLSADGNNAFDISYDKDFSNMQPTILHFDSREDAAVQGLPDYFTADGYSGKFVPFDAVIRDHHVYFMAENYEDAEEPFCGLFYWNMAEDKNAERIELLQALPSGEYCNLAGVSGEGFCYVLINGVIPESAEGDVQEHLKEKRERILALIG